MLHHRKLRHRGRGATAATLRAITRTPLVSVLIAVLVTGPLWAVAVEVEVTGPGGDPVPGATVDLGLGIPPVTTGDDGRATVDVDEDLIEEERDTVAVILFPPDPRTGERRREEVPVKLGPQRLLIPVGPPPGTGAPARRPLLSDLPTLGCLMNGGRFQIQAGLGTTEIDGTPLERQFLVRNFRVDGSVVDRMEGPRSAAEIAEINRTEKKNHDLDTEGAVSLRIPLRPGICGRGGRGIVPVPSITIGAQRIDSTFESLPVGMPQFNQAFWGDGNAWSAGIDLAFLREGSRHYVVVGGEYGKGDHDAVRTVDVAGTFFPTGAVTVTDRASYEHERISARVLWGYAFRGDRVMVQLGPQVTDFEADLFIDAVVDVTALFPSAPSGSQALVEDTATNLFSDEYVQAVAAVIASIGGPAVIHAEARVGEDYQDYRFGVGFRF